MKDVHHVADPRNRDKPEDAREDSSERDQE
jgi:hypothetical protein